MTWHGENMFRTFENKVLAQRETSTMVNSSELHPVYSSPDIIRIWNHKDYSVRGDQVAQTGE